MINHQPESLLGKNDVCSVQFPARGLGRSMHAERSWSRLGRSRDTCRYEGGRQLHRTIRRSAFDLSRNLQLSEALCDRVCTELVPGHVNARHAVEDVNDADGGHEAVLALFDAYLRREAHVN